MNLILLLAAILAQDPIFSSADPKPAIEAAKKKAAAENRRVLVLWGSNDSEESRTAAAMLKNDKEIAKLILYEYDLVLAKSADGAPRLSILTPDGKSLLDAAPPAEPAAVRKLLKEMKATPRVAKDVLAAASKEAADAKKRVLLTFGAPW
jgi:hypothetical protein